MGMMSEIATEGTLRLVCKDIEHELTARADQPDAVAALKAVGRKALTHFEWDTPEWAARFAILFTD